MFSCGPIPPHYQGKRSVYDSHPPTLHMPASKPKSNLFLLRAATPSPSTASELLRQIGVSPWNNPGIIASAVNHLRQKIQANFLTLRMCLPKPWILQFVFLQSNFKTIIPYFLLQFFFLICENLVYFILYILEILTEPIVNQ